jgi:Ca-activated chloride channel family protein
MPKSPVFVELPVHGKAQSKIPLPAKTRWPRKVAYLAFAFALLAPGHFFAQSDIRKDFAPNHDQKPVGTFTLHVDEVDLPFVVADRHHHWITNLSQDELRLRDNGLPPESIRIFESRSGLPLRVGLIVDKSDSVSQQFTYEKDAAALFISQLMNSSQDLAFVLGFSDQPALVQDLTPDTQALATAVRNLTLGGGTAVYDAVHFACERLSQQKDTRYTRRVLVLLTDGDDNRSQFSPALVIDEALRKNVVVIVLDTNVVPGFDNAKHKIMEKLATVTGGQILPAGNKKQLAKAFGELSSSLRSYYLLAYRPSQFTRDGSFHKIQLKATRRGMHIICRKGYYAAQDAVE